MDNIKRIGTGVCFILVPLILMVAFASHPNLQDLTPPGADVDAWISEFHGNTRWRVAHVAALLVAMPLMVVFLECMRMLRDKAAVLSFVAGVAGLIGCVMLAADKGALALVPTAFDTLPEEQFRQLRPGLEAMMRYQGWMGIVKLYALIFVGFVLMGLALIKAQLVPAWQGLAIVLGGLLLFNPDIDLVSLLASMVLAVGFMPIGWSILHKTGSGTAFKRWLYRGQRPNWLARILNRAWAIVASSGVTANYLVTLEVTGRKSGRTISLPVVMAVVEGERYLVSMLGENSQWVQNVRAAGGRAVLRSGGREDVHLEEVPAAQRPSILKAYLQRAPGARPHVPLNTDATLAECTQIATAFPVFRVASPKAM